MIVPAIASHSLPSTPTSLGEPLAQQAFQQMPWAALLIDAQGRLIEANAAFCQQLGYRRADLIGQLFTTLIPSAHLSSEVQEHLVFFAHPPTHPTHRSAHLLGADQHAHLAEILESRIQNTREEFFRLLLIQELSDWHQTGLREPDQESQKLLQEIDSLRQQNAKLQEQLQIKDTFLATAAHELRSPMSNIKIAAQMLRSCCQPERQQTYLRILEQECEQEITLISDLLDLQSMAAHASTPVPELLPLQTWIRSLVEPFQIPAQQRQQQIQLKLAPSLQNVMLDRKLLQRILCELLNNATKYTPDRGQIWIHTQPHPQRSDQWRLQVRNSISPLLSSPERLFEPFYRDPNTSSQAVGSGLGLSLVRRAVETLGGTISVQSEADSLCFQVDLPLQLAS